jgi:hypothetical protein
MRALLVVVVCAAACTGRDDPRDAGGAAPTCDAPGPLRTVDVGAHGAEWNELQDGDVVPCFDRPQGGVGTHLTMRFTGFTEDELTSADLLRIEMNAQDDGRIISGYRTRAFPVDCADDGALLLLDVPVRFDVSVAEAASIEGVDVALVVALESDDDAAVYASSVDVTLQESDFIPPAWWEDDDG